MIALALLTMLATAPATLEDDRPLQFARLNGTFVATSLSCESKDGLVFVQTSPPALHVVARGDGAPVRTVPLQALPPQPEFDCGAGTCFFQHSLSPLTGPGTFQLTGQQSNYYGSWTPFISLREQGVESGLKAACPGERLLAVCFTARRTVQVLVSGDPNDTPARFGVDYVATSPGAEKHETLHLAHGKVKKANAGYEVTFRNRGFTYSLRVSSASAALDVHQGAKSMQSEECVSYGFWPRHLDAALGRGPTRSP